VAKFSTVTSFPIVKTARRYTGLPATTTTAVDWSPSSQPLQQLVQNTQRWRKNTKRSLHRLSAGGSRRLLCYYLTLLGWSAAWLWCFVLSIIPIGQSGYIDYFSAQSFVGLPINANKMASVRNWWYAADDDNDDDDDDDDSTMELVLTQAASLLNHLKPLLCYELWSPLLKL